MNITKASKRERKMYSRSIGSSETKTIKKDDSDFNQGYEMGYINGCQHEDMPWWELNEEEHRGYILGFQNGWDNTFGGGIK